FLLSTTRAQLFPESFTPVAPTTPAFAPRAALGDDARDPHSMRTHAKNTVKEALFVCSMRARRDSGHACAAAGMRLRRREKKSGRELNSVRRDRAFPRRGERFAQTLRTIARPLRPSGDDDDGGGSCLRRTFEHRARPSIGVADGSYPVCFGCRLATTRG